MGWEGGFWGGKLVKLESLLKALLHLRFFIFPSRLFFLPSTITASFLLLSFVIAAVFEGRVVGIS